LKSIWNLQSYDAGLAANLQQKLLISPNLARLLTQRGINTYEEAYKFLYGQLQDLTDPFSLSGLNTAVARIQKAVNEREKIIIYGDYDVDGVCSTVLLKQCLEKLGGSADYYIPDRFSEGYGINQSAIEYIANQGYQLIISVDCGITSVTEVKMAAQLGVDVIITDHHNPSCQLPPACAVINPKLDDNPSSRDLAGVGVAFMLAMALCRYEQKNPAFNWLDLVALATVADVVPLLGDNRILVKYGLKSLQNTSLPGLKALIKETGLVGKDLNVWHIGFLLAPRLNAAGRLNSARLSAELLLTKDNDKALELARALCQFNNERKAVEDQILADILKVITDNPQLEEEPALIFAGDSWHSGVIGIVASRICDRYGVPVILISWEGDTGKGSCRSLSGVDIFEGLVYCQEYLEEYGGHKLAAGITIKRENFLLFKEQFCAWIKDAPVKPKTKKQVIHLEIDLADVNSSLMEELQILQPFGEGNPYPVFALRSTEIASGSLVGKNQEHFKFKLHPSGMDCIAFNGKEFIQLPYAECYHDIVCKVENNEFRGKTAIQINVADMKPAFVLDRLESSTPSYSILSASEKTIEELRRNNPVLYVFPTLRSLIKLQPVLKGVFKSSVIQVLHGALYKETKDQLHNILSSGVKSIFLTTESYRQYLVKNKLMPQNLNLIVQVWPDSLDNSENYQIEKILKPQINLKWRVSSWSSESYQRILIYANRNNTVKRLNNQLSPLINEIGIKDGNRRRKLRQRFMMAEKAALLFDGGYPGGLIELQNVDKLVFADVPYSYYDTLTVMDQMAASHEMEAVALFAIDDFNFYRQHLLRLYPRLDTINAVLTYFKKMHTNSLRGNITRLAANIGEFLGKPFKEYDFWPVLYILADLGLCRIKKQGSIIAINLVNSGEAILKLSESSYYREGVREKTAFANWETELKNILFNKDGHW